jgi:sulfonate transport system permease protein
MNATLHRRLSAYVLPALILAGWEAATHLGIFPAYTLPAPSTVLQTLYLEARSGELWIHIAASSWRVLAGFAIGTTFAVTLGTMVGLSQGVESFLDPTLQAIRSIPTLGWVPLLLLWMGIGEAPKLTLIAVGAFFPTYVATTSGIRSVDRKLVEVGNVYGLNRIALARRIILPGALPSMVVGLRTGMGVAWLFVVVAELIAASRGVGFMLTDGRENSRADLILGAILLLALLGKLSDGALKWLERRLLYWRDAFTGETVAAAVPPGAGVKA